MTNNEVLALPHGHVIKSYFWPWLVRLSGLSASLQTERSLGRFPVRAHAWIAGQVPGWGHARSNQSIFLWHIDISLPLFLPTPLFLKINEVFLKRYRHL